MFRKIRDWWFDVLSPQVQEVVGSIILFLLFLLVLWFVFYGMWAYLLGTPKEIWAEWKGPPQIVRVDTARYASEDYIVFLKSRPTEIELKKYEVALLDRVDEWDTKVDVIYKMISVLNRFGLEQNTDSWEANAVRVFVGDLSDICKYRKLGAPRYQLKLLYWEKRCVTGEE